MPSRQDQVLDAAIQVLATGGMRQLTHRAVDAAAGFPLGSASNHFRTREALLVGVLRRILDRESAIWTRLGVEIRTTSIESAAEGIGRLLEELTTAERVLSQARRTVFVEAANQPVLGREISRVQGELLSWMAPLLGELGSSRPQRDVHHLLALIDGLMGHQLASPRPDFDPAAAVAALLRGIAGRALEDEGPVATAS